MGKLKLFVLLLLCATAAGAQTTMDEYNYCTKGYRLVTESGMTPKMGYTVETVPAAQAKYGQYQIGKLIEQSTGQCKALIVDYWKADLVHHYFCIPRTGTDAELAERTYQDWTIYLGIIYLFNLSGWVIILLLFLRLQ